MEPRYLTLSILDKDKDEFILLCPMNPKARTNLRSLCVVGCDGPNYGKIVVFRFPKGVLVHGPQQMEAFINQDTASPSSSPFGTRWVPRWTGAK
jgi:uncharacterized membrane protein (UPF0182 family)